MYINYFDRPKHPTKVHVWAGISMRGATNICIFDGIMDAVLFTDILDKTFINKTFPDGHRCSRRTMILNIPLVWQKTSWKIGE